MWQKSRQRQEGQLELLPEDIISGKLSVLWLKSSCLCEHACARVHDQVLTATDIQYTCIHPKNVFGSVCSMTRLCRPFLSQPLPFLFPGALSTSLWFIRPNGWMASQHVQKIANDCSSSSWVALPSKNAGFFYHGLVISLKHPHLWV